MSFELFEPWMVCGAAGVVAALIVFLLLALWFRAKLQGFLQAIESKSAAPSPAVAGEAKLAGDVRDLMEQMDLLIHDLEGKLDARMDNVENALKQADIRIESIRKEAAGLADQLETSYAQAVAHAEGAGHPIWEPPTVAALATAAASPMSAHASVNAVAPAALDAVGQDGGVDEEDVVTLPGSWPVPASRRPASAGQAPTPVAGTVTLKSGRHSEILRLQGEGISNVEIARKLQMDIGEVELVLNLNRSRQTQKS